MKNKSAGQKAVERFRKASQKMEAESRLGAIHSQAIDELFGPDGLMAGGLPSSEDLAEEIRLKLAELGA